MTRSWWRKTSGMCGWREGGSPELQEEDWKLENLRYAQRNNRRNCREEWRENRLTCSDAGVEEEEVMTDWDESRDWWRHWQMWPAAHPAVAWARGSTAGDEPAWRRREVIGQNVKLGCWWQMMLRSAEFKRGYKCNLLKGSFSFLYSVFNVFSPSMNISAFLELCLFPLLPSVRWEDWYCSHVCTVNTKLQTTAG